MLNCGVDIIVPYEDWNQDRDTRKLIPFIKGTKIGFVNEQREVVVEPKYDLVQGNVYRDDDYVKVGIVYSYAYEKKNSRPYVYTRTKWGLLNSKGECVLETNYSGIVVGENTIIVRRAYGYEYDGAHALLDLQGKPIVPFGIYWDIEPFENGLARCRNKRLVNGDHLESFGVINEQGEVVLECKERQIMPFYQHYKNRYMGLLKRHLREENPIALEKYFHEKPSVKRWKLDSNSGSESFDSSSSDYFRFNDCYDYEGNFDYGRLEDAILDGEYVPEDW